VLTDTAPHPSNAVRFVLRGVATSLGLFGLLRLTWVASHVLLPVTRLQAGLGTGLFGAPTSPVEATLACSGSDALALCLGAILAYPVSWRARLAGACGGATLILGLNTLRLGTLGRAAASPGWFSLLHLYVWPAVLTIAIAGFVFAWMRVAEGPQALNERTAKGDGVHAWRLRPSQRFVVLTVAFLILFSVASALASGGSSVLSAGTFIARVAALILGIFGVSAHAAANVLWTPRGGFAVTQECIATPLIPVTLAAICAYSATWRRLFLGILAAAPLFAVLAILRLLLVALPGEVASPEFFVHAFYQLLLGAVVVVLAALWRHAGRPAAGHALAGIVAGVLFVYLLGPFYTRVVMSGVGTPLDDPQGAIALLPAFQVGLYLALWLAASIGAGWSRFFGGLAALGVTQTTGLLALHALASYAGMAAHVRDIRGWAVAGPVLVFAAVVHGARPRH